MKVVLLLSFILMGVVFTMAYDKQMHAQKAAMERAVANSSSN